MLLTRADCKLDYLSTECIISHKFLCERWFSFACPGTAVLTRDSRLAVARDPNRILNLSVARSQHSCADREEAAVDVSHVLSHVIAR